jgi:hypothetical protein
MSRDRFTVRTPGDTSSQTCRIIADTRWFSSYCSLCRLTSETDRRGVSRVIRRFVNVVHRLSGDYPLFVNGVNYVSSIQRVRQQAR